MSPISKEPLLPFLPFLRFRCPRAHLKNTNNSNNSNNSNNGKNSEYYETKSDILGLLRAYLVIPAWWCLYLARDFV